MKKTLITFILAVFFGLAAFAQASINPSASFYSNLERWEIMGLIEEEPPMRPYPLKLIQSILDQVIESDNEAEAQIARDLYEEIFDSKPKIKFESLANLKIGQKDKAKQIIVLPGLNGDYAFSDIVSLGYEIDESITNNRSLNALPLYSAQPYFFQDPARISKLEACLDMDAGLAIGTENLYAQLGINNNSFGPFYSDNAVISPLAKHSANFSFVYKNDYFTYTQAMLGLSAANAYNEYLYPQKYLALHSVNANIFEWLSASYYEVMLYGDRFEPAYIIPAPFMVTQGLSGYEDNLFMGLSFTIRPVKNLVWVNDFYIDDLGFNELIKFNFDTKIRGSFQTALKYSPDSLSWLDMLKLDYTLLTPYMYSHWQDVSDAFSGQTKLGSMSALNYQQYTNAGHPLGLTLAPNSDRVSLAASFKPIKNLKIDLKASYTRHANVNESISVEEALAYLNSPEGYLTTDGSINNHQQYLKEGNPDTKGYLPSAWNHFMFMTQEHKMQIFRTDLDAEYSLSRTKAGSFYFTLGYSFEFIKNYGVEQEIFKGSGPGKTEADVQAALEEWKNGLHDIWANYLRIGFKYIW